MLSKRARAALDVLSSEAHGDKAVSSAIASIRSALTGAQQGDSSTPGAESARAAAGKPSSKSSPNGATAAGSSFVEMMKKRRSGAAQK